MRQMRSFDLDAGLLVGVGAALYAGVVGGIRGAAGGTVSGALALGAIVAFAALGFAVGGLVAGRPDFGPTTRAALFRGFIATVPVYAAGGLVFLPPDQWVPLLPLFSVAPAALVGPPIGIFMYRLYRRSRPESERPGLRGMADAAAGTGDRQGRSPDPSVSLAWQKGELLGSWTPLVVTVALFASFGLGTLAIELADLEFRGLGRRPEVSAGAGDRLPLLFESIARDSTNAAARFELGTLLAAAGRFDDAVTQLRDAARLDSTVSLHWRMLGRAAFYARQPDLALEAYWNAQRIDPAVIRSAGLDRMIWEALLNAGP